MLRPGLRAEILLSLTLLLVVAMALTSFVILRITKRDLIRYKIADGMAVVHRIQAAVDEIKRETGSLDLDEVKERLRAGISWIAQSGLYQQIVVLGSDRTVWVGVDHLESSEWLKVGQIASVFATQKPTTELNSEGTLLTITAPIHDGDRCIPPRDHPR